MARLRQVMGAQDEEEEDADEPSSGVRCVLVKQSLYLDAFHGHIAVRLTVDSGATGDMMKVACAMRSMRLGVTVKAMGRIS